MERCTLYRTWAVGMYVGELLIMHPPEMIHEMAFELGAALESDFGDNFIGIQANERAMAIIAVFKHELDAMRLINDWETVVGMITPD
jgi:hypothetical protein